MQALTCSAHEWPSPTLPISMEAGVSERVAGDSVTGVSMTRGSVTGGSSAGVS